MNTDSMDRQALKKASLNGAVVNMTSQILKFGLMFVNQVVMARLLMPEDFGLLAMVAPIMAFVVLFADLGLSQATIQRPQISQTELSFLFWTNMAVATALSLVVMVIAPLVGLFYHEPRVVAITVILGATLILSGLNSQHIALLTRHMQFIKLALFDIITLISGFIAGVIAALNGLNYWSLLVVHITIYLTNTFLVWTFSSWRPGKPVLPENWKSLLGFGGNLSGFNFVNYFARNLDNILIGRFSGEAPLGLYDRAYKLLLMPLTQITQPFARIALPLLSRTRGETEVYKKAYFRIVEVIMLITYPGVLYAIVDSDNLIVTVLGEKWAEVAPIFAILGIGALFSPLGVSTGWLFISQDRTREMRNWGALSSLLFVGSFVAGLPWGPLGVATAYVSVGAFQGPLIWWASTRQGPIAFRDILKMLIPFLPALTVTSLMIHFMAAYVLPKGIWPIVVLLPMSYIVFTAVFFALPSGRKILLELLKHGMTMFVPFLARFRPKQVDIEKEL